MPSIVRIQQPIALGVNEESAVGRPTRVAVKCELCCRQDALPDCRLCQACSEAIVRLMVIRERSRSESLEAAQHANNASISTRAFSPFAG